MSETSYTIYIISDSTGETAATMIRAALVQYPNKDVSIIRCKNVRTENQAESLIEECFQKFIARSDIAIILINQHVANDIRHILKNYTATIPTVLEIPSKEHPYDPEQDYIMQRVNMYLGGNV